MLGLASRWGVKGLDGYVAQLAKDLLAAAADSAKSRRRPHRRRAAAHRPPQDRPAGRPRPDRPRHGEDPARTGERPDRRRGAERLARGRDGPRRRDGADDARPRGRPASWRCSARRTGRARSSAGSRRARCRCRCSRSRSRRPSRPTRTSRSPSGPRPCSPRAAACPTRIARRSSRRCPPVVLKGGDASRGKEVFKKECAKCHTHSGEGGKVGPDLTGMAAHPKSELIVHILDPSRSVEGNFLQYTVVDHRRPRPERPARGRDEDLGRPARRRGEEADDPPRGHRRARLLEEVAHARGVREDDPGRGAGRPARSSSRRRGSTCRSTSARSRRSTTTKPLVSETGPNPSRLVFEDWGPKVVDGVPFALVDPQGDRVPNAVMLQSTFGTIPPKMPK